MGKTSRENTKCSGGLLLARKGKDLKKRLRKKWGITKKGLLNTVGGEVIEKSQWWESRRKKRQKKRF